MSRNNNKIIKNLQPYVLFILLFFSFSKSWGQVSITTTNTAYTDNFSTFTSPAAGIAVTAANSPANWTISTANNWQGTAQTTGTSGGWYGNNNLSFLGSGSASNGNATWKLQNNTGCTITSFTISFVARMWKTGTASPNVTLSYTTNTSGTVPANGNLTSIGTFNDATTNISTGTTLTYVVSSVSIANGDFIYIRFLHAGGSSSDNIGWDDVSIKVDGNCGCTNPNTPPVPTTVSNPACSSATLSVGSSTVSGVTWYWQTSASGTSTTQPTSSDYTTAATATVFVRAQDNTGLCWSTASSSLAVTVNTPPSITTQPTNTTVCSGNNAGFSVAASGSPLTYQWQQNTGSGYSNISGATSSALSLTGVTSAMNSYSYQCVVSVAGCSSATSNAAVLTVNTTPAAPPAPSVPFNPACTTGTFSAMSSNVSGVTWYWQTSASGTSTTLPTSSNYTTASTATVFVRAQDNIGLCWSASSSSAAVTVNTAPSITLAPVSKTVCEGSGTTFTASASGSSPTYQWYENTGAGYNSLSNTGIYSGTGTKTLTLTGSTISMNTYSYLCVASVSGCSSASTTPVVLTVIAIPTAPPTPSLITSCNPAIISETVVATPPAGVTWYWSSNANSPVSYTSAVNNYSATSSGTVYIRAMSDVGTCWNSTVTTNSVVVTVVKSPTISTQPTSSVVCQGTTASIKVTMSASSSTVMTYQWQENTGSGFANVTNGSPYTISVGTYTSTLDIDGTKPIGTYTYQCVISNSCGTVTTNIVTVTVTATPANDLCSSATPVVIDAGPVIGNLTCASPSSGLTYAATKNDVWYAFTPTCTASHTVTMNFTTSGADYDLDVFTTGACPASGTATYTSHGTTTVETVSQTFTSGVTYYIRVIDYNTSGGTFSISVASNCGSPHVVTFNANGGSGTMSNQTSSTATSLTSNAFTNSGCAFVAWNDSANANGTTYANNAVYSFTADVTLYAQWNCSSGGGTAGCPYLVSAVINACSGTCNAEGSNEIVVMNSGSYPISVNGTNINLYYSGGTNHYFTNTFAASSGTVVTNLNTLTATSGCTNTPFVFVPSGGTIPSNSNFMILNSGSCLNGDFSAYCNVGPVYVIISTDADWSAGGYFGNNNTPRYFRTDFSSVNSGCGLTTYNYNNPSTFSFGTDGASVTYSGTTASYVNGNGTCAPSIVILPIDLIDFYGTQSGSVNFLNWKVATEKNVTQYVIQKSEDGINFTELTRIRANRIESAYQSYSCEDSAPFSGITYYKLSTLESNGKVNHYKIIDVDRSNKEWKTLLYQNNDDLVVEFKNAIPKNAQVNVFDLSGKLLIESSIKDLQTKIYTGQLSTGIYFVKVSTPYKTENFKIIISQ